MPPSRQEPEAEARAVHLPLQRWRWGKELALKREVGDTGDGGWEVGAKPGRKGELLEKIPLSYPSQELGVQCAGAKSQPQPTLKKKSARA